MAQGCILVLAIVLFTGLSLGKTVPKAQHETAEDGVKASLPTDPFASMDMSRSEYFATKGMGSERYAQHQVLMRTYKQLVADKMGYKLAPEQLEGDLLDDILLSNEQLQYEISRLQKRQKRKVINVDDPTNPYKPWGVASDIPVPFMFDSNHTTAEKNNIRGAVTVWNTETCVILEEHFTPPATHYILITSDDSQGCWSMIGYDTSDSPQQVNLPGGCLSDYDVGTATHELGHALGFFHEQSRWDRDSYVEIYLANVILGYQSNFVMAGLNELSTLDIPYDLSSVMHYYTKAFARDPANEDTIMPINHLYDYNLGGQYNGISFFDTKIFNKQFCTHKCPAEPNCDCERDGYADPKSCIDCKCPDGWGGNRCQQMASSDLACNAPTNGIINVTSDVPQCFAVRAYPSSTSCNFHLQGTLGTRTQVWFQDIFGALCSESARICYHWVEIIYDANLSKRGPRFCCYDTPQFPDQCDIMSEGEDIVVTFRSDYDWTPLAGFELCYKQVNTGDACFNHNS